MIATPTPPEMPASATITITSGPDRGKVFHCGDDVLHIGKGPDNQIVLLDPDLHEHQASLVKRNGRYAIYTPLPEAVGINDSHIPADQWVWLPPGGRVRLGRRTVLEVTLPDAPPAENLETDPAPSPKPRPSPGDESETPAPAARASNGRRRRAGEEAKSERPSPKTKRVTARFLTDAQGVSRVQLGEDGQLPELRLSEKGERAALEKRKNTTAEAGGGSALLYVVLGISLLSSMLMLLIDPAQNQSSAINRQQALRAIVNHYGTDDAEPEPFQLRLREAALARSRGDRDKEREAYRQVLRWLRAEDNQRGHPLTGSRAQDRDLEELLTILVAD